MDKFPEDISHLRNQLTLLSLGKNNISGALPKFNDFALLTFLNVGSNKFEGAISGDWFSGCASLGTLVLAGNAFSGNNIDFNGLPLLTDLEIDGNSFSGSLPSLVGLPRLLNLDVSDNKFSGTIPAS